MPIAMLLRCKLIVIARQKECFYIEGERQRLAKGDFIAK